jgi:hypothetical protein
LNSKFPLKTVQFLRVKGIDNLILYSIWLYHYWASVPVEYMCTAYTVYMHFYTIYSFITKAIKCERLTSVVFYLVHSYRTVVDLLHKNFRSWLNTFCNSVSIIRYCTYTTMSKSNIRPYVNNLFTFFKAAYYIQFLLNTNFLSLSFSLGLH